MHENNTKMDEEMETIMEYQFKLTSSLEKIFFGPIDQLPETVEASILKNERFSFQLVGWTSGHGWSRVNCGLQVESELAPWITVRRVGYVPSTVPSMTNCDDDDYITKSPGLFPDPLYSIEDGVIELADEQSRAFWITVDPREQKTGTFPIILRITDKDGQSLSELCFTLTILDCSLPEQKLRNTGWFHGDCIAKAHGVEMLSEAHFELLEKYIAVYADFGHNMILTPVFTPPLDTAVGGERPTIQLVDVTAERGAYTFGFDKLGRWIRICRDHGIRYFEISHLFTQWGAQFTPKVMGYVDGVYKKLFGWETDALSAEYRAFLDAFLPALTTYLREEGVLEQCYFHVSDEPFEEHQARYQAAKELLLPYVKESQMIDALGNFEFYEKGIVKKPVVATNHVQPFLDHNVENLWVYYCCAQGKDVANRFMSMPSYRNRILGYQLYKYQIEGFLQWGFNFWFSQYSTRLIDPYANTDSDGGFQSGDAFLVYPVDEKGDVVCSLRLYVFHEALQDLRALELLESLTSREEVLTLLTEVQNFDTYPRNSAYILTLREKINQRIQQAMA